MGLLTGVLPRTVQRPDAARVAGRAGVDPPRTTPSPENGWSDERICLLGVLAVATFIVYGSLVPFDFRQLAGLNPGGLLAHMQFTPWSLMSASDVFVNIAVGAPLGFVVTGVLRARRRGGALAALAIVLVVGGMSAILGVGVELLQALSPTRRSSWNDVWAQALGAGAGAVVWMFAGRRAIQWLRDLGNEHTSWSFAARLLQLYLPIYVVLQLTPFDSGRAAEVATIYNAGQGALMPSVHSIHARFPIWLDLAGSTLLTIPIGCLAVLGWARTGTRRAGGWAFLMGVSLLVAVGIARYALWGNGPGRELYVGVVSITIGVAAATAWRPHDPRVNEAIGQPSLARRWMLVAAAAWTLVLIVHSWYPFDFALTPDIVTRRLTRISFAPFGFYYWYAAYIVNPLGAVHETLLNFVRAVPLGFFLRLAWPVAGEARIRRLQTVATTATAITVLIAIELGQAFLPMRFPDVTDALLGIFGATVGIAIVPALMRRRSTIASEKFARKR
jgi:glycopeptide antibiotics resistance protein